jgi:hypothetical protein
MSYRSALLLVLAVFVLHFSRIIFSGEVIFPHDNSLETGAATKEDGGRISNRKFSDESNAFIPELTNNLQPDRKGWLPTWNPHVQFGRPSGQSALSRAFALTNLLSFFTANAFVLYTALVLLTVALTAGFFVFFLRSLGLHPAACAGGAVGLAFTTPVSYWLCFVMFVAAICWPVCLLWLVTEFTRKPSWPVAFGLVFATYCLLLTSYPQVTVLSAYLVGAYAVTRLLQLTGTWRSKSSRLFALLGCASAGLLAALPVLLDLFSTAKDSSRLGRLSDNFFLSVLPPAHDAHELLNFLVNLFDWSWLGNAIDPKYPLPFNGLSFTPVYGTLIWLSFLVKNRRATLFWQVFLLACLAGTIFPSVYLFAVHYLGFGLSRIQLGGGGIIPGFVLSAITMDAIIRGEFRFSKFSAIWLLLPIVGESLVALLFWNHLVLRASAIALTVLLVGAVLCALRWRSIPALVAVSVVSTFFFGRHLILSRPPDSIHTSSDLVAAIQSHAPAGGRFAIADNRIVALPPNQEALLNLNSVSSYDSLSSRRYQEMTRRWSTVGTGTYGRYFSLIDPNRALSDPDFRFSNVRVILSLRALTTNELSAMAEINGIKLYRTTATPVDLLQTTAFRLSNAGEATIDSSFKPQTQPPRRLKTLNDFQQIELAPSAQETLLFLSQQFHRRWHAEAKQHALSTVIVNGFYQGVVVPPNTKMVELSFRPLVIWSWVPQVLFAIGGILLLLRAAMRWRPKISQPADAR